MCTRACTHTHAHTQPRFAVSQTLGFQAAFCHTITVTLSGLSFFTCKMMRLDQLISGCFQFLQPFPNLSHSYFAQVFPTHGLTFPLCPQTSFSPSPLNPRDSRRQV